MRVRALLGAAVLFGCAGADWPTFDGNAARAAYLRGDDELGPATVGGLRRRWVTTLARAADSSPIVLSRVKQKRGGTRAMLFVTDKSGTTYGLDARSGEVRWHFATAGPGITTATPVADPRAGELFAGGVDGRIHRLVAETGAELHRGGFPVRLTRMPQVEKNASALNLAGGYLYAVTSGYIGDAGPYDGHVVAVRVRDGATHVFNSLCSNERTLLLDTSYDARSPHSCAQQRSGIWARAGAVVDPDPAQRGRVYVATGNGAFDADRGGHDYGDSVLALAADGSRLEDWYAPANYRELELSDADLGSSSPAMLPREARSRTPLLLIAGGKDAVLHLLDRTHLGGLAPAVQDFPLPDRLFTAPAVWRDSSARTWIYLGFLPGATGLTALRLATDAAGRSRLETVWTSNVSATSPAVQNGVVFVAQSNALRALDARTGRDLWSSEAPGAGGTIGAIHWQSPALANGWLYVPDQSGRVSAYALPGAR